MGPDRSTRAARGETADELHRGGVDLRVVGNEGRVGCFVLISVPENGVPALAAMAS